MEDNDLPATQPVESQILKDVVAFVDVRTGHNNQSTSIAEVLQLLGAMVSTKLNKSVTHVIFKDGGQGTYRKAKKLGVHLLSVLWIESCRQNGTKVTEHLFPAQVSEAYDGPVRLRKMKCMQPVDLEEDLAKSAARIKRREKAAFRREIRRKCLGPRADGSNPLYNAERVPFVYEENDVPDVVLTPSAFDNYKSSSGDSCDECILPLVQRLFMRYPDSPEIKDYIQKNGRFRVRSGTPGYPTDPYAAAGKVCNDDTSLHSLPRLALGRSLDQSAIEASQVPCSIANSSPTIHGTGLNNGSKEITITTIAGDPDHFTSCKTMGLNDTSRGGGQCRVQSESARITEGGAAMSSPRSSRLSKIDNSSVLNEICNLHIGRRLHCAGKHKVAADHTFLTVEDHNESSRRLVEIAEKQITDTPNVTPPKKSRGAMHNKSSTSNYIAAVSSCVVAELALSSEAILSGATGTNCSNSLLPKVHASGVSVTTTSPIYQESPADKASEPEGFTRSANLLEITAKVTLLDATFNGETSTTAANNVKRPSRNSLDEFKPVFSRRTKRVLSLDECRSPGEVRAQRNSTSRKTALPNLMTKHIVLTSFTISEKETLVPILKMLGGYRLSYIVDRCTTHLVTGASRRTINSLLATVRGCWILSKEWVFKSLEAGMWLDEQPYELACSFPAAQFHRLERSRVEDDIYASNLFGNLGPIAVSSGTNIPEKQLKELLQLAGGNVVKDFRKACIIIGPLPTSNDATCISELWVLNSITNHRTLPFDEYQLSASNK